MSTNFPINLDTFTNPTATDTLAVVSHSAQHVNINDAVSAIEAKVGKNSSAVTTSHDYKLSGVTGSDKAVSKTGTETLTNKTFTAPKINVGSDATGDMYYRDAGGILTRISAGTDGQILTYTSGIPSAQANPNTINASTTVAGVVEQGTTAEIDAGTSTGATGAKLFMSPDQFASSKYGIGKKTGVSTVSTVASSKVIAHGLGTTPRFVRITAQAASGTSTIAVMSVGTYDVIGTNQQCIYTSNTSSSTNADASHILFISPNTGSTITTAGTCSVDATNITIAFTNQNGGQVHTLLWEVES